MKKFLSILLTMVICTSLMAFFPLNTSAYSNLSYFPINYDYWVTIDSDGVASLHFSGYNNTDKDIIAYEILITPKDAYGRNVSEFNLGNEYAFTGIAQNFTVSEYGTIDHYWTLDYYYNASYPTTAELKTVLFADGSVWENNGREYYQESSFATGNDQTANGLVIVNSNREVQLFEYGCSVYHRDWYIWDDAYGWVWFSDSIDPVCQVWGSGASIKHVINNNPNLYSIVSFSVVSAPEFQISCYNTNESYDTSTTSNATFTISYGDVSLGGEYVFNLWDKGDAQVRNWYWWDEITQRWIWFSNERGPSCHLWREGDFTIKLEHNNDPSLTTYFDLKINDYTNTYI